MLGKLRGGLRGLGAVAAIAGVLLAMGTAKATAATTILFWNPFPYYANVYAKMVAEFHKVHPDIDVKVTGMQESEYRTAVNSALAAKAGPDVITAVPGRTDMDLLANSGALTNLAPYYKKFDWTHKYPKWILDDMTYKTTSGHKGIWVVPTHIAPVYLFYDPELFAKHGWKVPTTLGEFLSYCKEAKSAGLIPLSLGDGSGGWMGVEYAGYLLNQTAGAAGVNSLIAGKSSWTSPGIVRGAAVFAQLEKAGCFEPGVTSITPPTSLALWTAGKAGMAYEGDWFFGVVKQQNPALYARMKLLPGQKIDQTAPWVPTSALGDSLAITSFSKHKDAAAAWLNYMTSKAGQLIWMHDAGRVVPGTALNTKENGASAVQIQDAKWLASGNAVDIKYVLWPETYNALEKALQNVLNGSQTPAQAMASVQSVDQQQWKKSP